MHYNSKKSTCNYVLVIHLLRIICEIFPALSLGIIVSLIHLCALLCVILVDIGYLVQLGLIFLLLINLILTLRRYVLLDSPGAIYKFGVGRDGLWYLLRKDGKLLTVVLRSPIFISYYLVILNFQYKARYLMISLPLWRDAFIDDNAWRKLRMLLRTGEHKPKSAN